MNKLFVLAILTILMFSALVFAEEGNEIPNCGYVEGKIIGTVQVCSGQPADKIYGYGENVYSYNYKCSDGFSETLTSDIEDDKYICKTVPEWEKVANEKCQSRCSPKCTDTDGGENSSVKGYAKGIWVLYKSSEKLEIRGYDDQCVKDDYPIGSDSYNKYIYGLYERFCNSDGYFDSKTITCDYGCNDGACLSTPTSEPEQKVFIKEKVACVFKNSNSNDENSCYASGKEFSCTGIADCLVDVKDVKEQKITWKSSCGGYQYTTVDGDDETVIFDCSVPSVKEEVTCYFQDSNTEQQCYSSDIDAGCKSNSECSIGVSAPKGKQITWKSSCGGYRYTTQDWQDEKVIFECASGETNSASLTGGYKVAYWECYNGESEKSGTESSCKPAELWKKHANEFCKDKCTNGKCGVNSFSVGDDCYFDVIYNEESDKGRSSPSRGSGEESSTQNDSTELDNSVLVCKDSCPLDGKCYQFGYRLNGRYCTDKSNFESQLAGDFPCDNNFQCSSNVCVNSKCVSSGLMDQIINWFKRIFGSG